jgi:uncharacterized protein (UPF0332 family)
MAFDERNLGDYGFDVSYPQDRAESLLARAQEFVDAVEIYLRKKTANGDQ